MENQEINLPPYTDYRIGNVVYFKEIDKQYKIHTIDSLFAYNIREQKITPVPISELINKITEYQFSGMGTTFYSIKNSKYLTYECTPYGNLIKVLDKEWREIKYFHQLQNLYYILEGKELEINL